MSVGTISNIVFLQVLWFAAILGAAHGWMIPAVMWFSVFLYWQLLRGAHRRQDLVLVVVATLAGFALDTLWVQMGWLSFSYSQPLPDVAPLWICMLWAGFALTLNHSLRWLQHRLTLAAALSMLSAPLSYFAASRLGAVDIAEPWSLVVALSLSWAIGVPTLLALARSLHQPPILGQVL